MTKRTIQLDLAYQLRATFRDYETQLSRYLASENVAVSTYYILRSDWSDAGKTQKIVAAQSNMTPSVASQLIKSLCKTGLLERRENSEDAREKLVFITKKGAKLRERLNEKSRELMDAICSDISQTDMKLTLKTLSAIQHKINEVD